MTRQPERNTQRKRRSFRRRRLVCVATAVLSSLGGTLDAAESGSQSGVSVNPFTEPTVRICREQRVQSELHLTPSQASELEALLDRTDGLLWSLRDLPEAKARPQVARIMDTIDAELARTLTPGQRARLEQIVLRARGPGALRDPAVAGRLGLTEDQQRQIRSSLDQTREAAKGLDRLVLKGEPRDTIDKLARQVQASQQREIIGLLSEPQRGQWAAMLGRPFDTSRLMYTAFKAPEFQQADAWINSKPLTLRHLRGQVVLVNFYTFGCGNCIHNYPSYKRWHETYASRGLTIVGIHTPETAGERNQEAVRAKARKDSLAWPILVDNSQANWNAWANQVWPSVYLIDRKGYVRNWWYGELNWQEKKGEALMSSRIEQLLAEPRPASLPSTVRQAVIANKASAAGKSLAASRAADDRVSPAQSGSRDD